MMLYNISRGQKDLPQRLNHKEVSMSLPRKRNVKDITGSRYCKLTAVSFVRVHKGDAIWVFRCDCGTRKEIKAHRVKSGNTKSCGCLAREVHKKSVRKAQISNIRHGMCGTRAYSSWLSMKKRCKFSYHESQYYADRGISVCDRWERSFEDFLEDMGTPPTPKHTIDRIDGDKGYELTNCRWATVKEQARNVSNNRFVEWGGKTTTVAELAEETGVKYSTIMWRVKYSKNPNKWGYNG